MQRKGSTVRYSAEELKSMRERGEGRSDWDRVKNLTDEEIERAIAEDPDAGTLPESWPEGVEIGMPKAKERITVRLDTDVLDWFRTQGKGYQTRINAVLKAFVDSQKRINRL
jgi:uncharacterized protein (DUF4415 family)